MEPVIQETETKSVLKKSNLPVADFSVNPYVGCAHAWANDPVKISV